MSIETTEPGPKRLDPGVAKYIAALPCLGLLFMAWVALAFDQWAAASLDVSFVLFFIAIGIVFGAAAWLFGRHWGYVAVACTYVLFVVALHFIDLSPVKPAVRAVHQMQAGMSESEVRAILEYHFPEHGRFKRPQMGNPGHDVICFALDPNDGRYNAALVEIKFSEGKCVTARFLPD